MPRELPHASVLAVDLDATEADHLPGLRAPGTAYYLLWRSRPGRCERAYASLDTAVTVRALVAMALAWAGVTDRPAPTP